MQIIASRAGVKHCFHPCQVNLLLLTTKVGRLTPFTNIISSFYVCCRRRKPPNCCKLRAFYTYNNGLAYRDSTGCTIYDNEAQAVLYEDEGLLPPGTAPKAEAKPKGKQPSTQASELRLKRGQAILQSVFDDLGHR